MANLYFVRICKLQHRKLVRRLDFDKGQIRFLIRADNFTFELSSVIKLHGNFIAPVRNMIVCYDISVFIDDET